MSRWLSALLLSALVLYPVGPAGGLPEAVGSAEAVVGGIRWVCPALGILTGFAVATGNWIAAGGLVVNAIRSGCIF